MKLVNIEKVIQKYNQNFKKVNDAVPKEDYNELLTAYNDLSDRLSAFLIATGKVPLFTPSLGNYVSEIKTISTSSYSFEIEQYTDDALDIDWGDGNTENTSGKDTDTLITLTHDYSTAGEYTITITNKTNDGSEAAIESLPVDKTSTAAFNGIHVSYGIDSDLEYGETGTITKLYVNNADHKVGTDEGGCILMNTKSLQELYIGDDTTTSCGLISNDCTALEKATFGSAVTQICYYDSGMFGSCSNLTEIHFKGTVPPSWSNYDAESETNLFFDEDYDSKEEKIPTGFTIYVPAASVNAYKAKDCFSKYADYIVGE
jgi:hypothetical protein